MGRDAFDRHLLHTPLSEPVLATGGHLANRIAIGVGREIFVAPSVGDLTSVSAWHAWVRQTEDFQRQLGVQPTIVAHDTHPDYLTTRFARSGGFVSCIPVQHHHAHVASLMIDSGWNGPVLGLAFDGTGYGDDGALWGGEFLWCEAGASCRLGALAPLPLPGGEAAIREPWRVAVAVLDQIYGDDVPWRRLRALGSIPEADRALIVRMARTGVHVAQAHGLGRYFDVVASIGLDCIEAVSPGALPRAWEALAGPRGAGGYDHLIRQDGDLAVLDLWPTLREAIAELVDGVAPAEVSSRFHHTVARGAGELASRLVANSSCAVGLTGGCFYNERLTAELLDSLNPDLPTLVHDRVPPGDAGLSVGQVLVAAEILSGARKPSEELTRWSP